MPDPTHEPVFNLTIYDASYLETAIRRKAKLATFDQKLAIAASKEKSRTRRCNWVP